MFIHANSNADSGKEVVSDGLETVHPGLETFEYPRHQYEQPVVNSYPPNGEASKSAPERMICGLRKVTFWLALVISVLAMAVVGVGVGVGLGVGLNQGNKSNESPTASSTNSPSTRTATDSGSTLSTTLSTTSSTASSSPCPAGNNTIHLEGARRFRILCDSDFTGGKEDLSATVLSSFYDCLGLCNSMNTFQNRSDVGCTYNREGTGGQTPGTCWCLGGNKTTTSNKGNDIAVPLGDRIVQL